MKKLEITTTLTNKFNIDLVGAKYFGVIVNGMACFISTDINGFYGLSNTSELKLGGVSRFNNLQEYLLYLITNLRAKVFKFENHEELFSWASCFPIYSYVKDPVFGKPVTVALHRESKLNTTIDINKYYVVSYGNIKNCDAIITQKEFKKGNYYVMCFEAMTQANHFLSKGKMAQAPTIEELIDILLKGDNDVYELDSVIELADWLKRP